MANSSFSVPNLSRVMGCDLSFEKSDPPLLPEDSNSAISPPPLRFNLVKPGMLAKSKIPKAGRREFCRRATKDTACVQCRRRKIRCKPDPRNANGICLNCSRIQQGARAPAPSLQHISREANLTDAILTWTANDPSTDILNLARTDNSLRQYIVESSTDYIKTFMRSKDAITRGVFSLACGNGSWDKV
jgi:hypothetical protein